MHKLQLNIQSPDIPDKYKDFMPEEVSIWKTMLKKIA